MEYAQRIEELEARVTALESGKTGAEALLSMPGMTDGFTEAIHELTEMEKRLIGLSTDGYYFLNDSLVECPSGDVALFAPGEEGKWVQLAPNPAGRIYFRKIA